MSERNIELLAKVRDHILAEPRRYNQTIVGMESDDAPCGTAACIFGWGGVLAGIFTVEKLQGMWLSIEPSVFEKVSDAFGFTIDEALAVAARRGEYWPSPYCNQFQNALDAGDKEAQARIAASYLDHIIAGGAITWDGEE